MRHWLRQGEEEEEEEEEGPEGVEEPEEEPEGGGVLPPSVLGRYGPGPSRDRALVTVRGIDGALDRLTQFGSRIEGLVMRLNTQTPAVFEAVPVKDPSTGRLVPLAPGQRSKERTDIITEFTKIAKRMKDAVDMLTAEREELERSFRFPPRPGPVVAPIHLFMIRIDASPSELNMTITTFQDVQAFMDSLTGWADDFIDRARILLPAMDVFTVGKLLSFIEQFRVSASRIDRTIEGSMRDLKAVRF